MTARLTQTTALELASAAGRGDLSALERFLRAMAEGNIANQSTFGINLPELRRDSAIKDALADSAGTSLLGLADAAGSAVVGTQTNNTSATENAAYQFVLPADYIAGTDVTVRVRARVSALRQVSATVDVVAKLVGDAALGSDICATAAQNLTASYADYDFTVTGTTLSPGSVLNLVFTLATNDTGGSTNGTPSITAISVLATTRGAL